MNDMAKSQSFFVLNRCLYVICTMYSAQTTDDRLQCAVCRLETRDQRLDRQTKEKDAHCTMYSLDINVDVNMGGRCGKDREKNERKKESQKETKNGEKENRGKRK